jgi:hypothetical protein
VSYASKVSKSEIVIEWKEGMGLEANGSKGSSSSSSSLGRWDERRDEEGVKERVDDDWSAIRGAAMARLDVARGEL